jgi:hypothetical protein
MNFCKYKNIFGIPGEGIHKYRFLNMALADILLTLLASIIISYLFKLSFLITTISLFILGIILHRLFCVRTTIDKLLF